MTIFPPCSDRLLMRLGFVLLILPGPAAIAVEYQSWQSPEATQGTVDDPQALIERLRGLVDEAERARAADPNFLRDLKQLIRDYDWPWSVSILNEDFTDGRVGSSPKWRVTAGDFRAQVGAGLVSTVQVERSAKSQDNTSQEELAAALLNQLLKQATKQQEQTKTQPKARADIHVATPISNAFALEATVASRDGAGRMEFAVFQGQPGGMGYQLAFSPDQQPSLELLRTSSGGVAVIDNYTRALSNNTTSALVWSREANGQMVVSVNGQELIRTVDRSFRDAFDGFAYSNLGGTHSIENIKLHGQP